ncbi:MAG: glycosyltransferase family 4 protein [Bacteroidales bacterium]|jgi:glycosyltransferase involved in cell wall biosynthesis|nr:glycosyltransferase family 4 protein [Bacteroidales bacterium]
MKILILSTFERAGGAAVAANRLMHALNKSGHEAKMLVRDKQTDDVNVVSINTNRWKKKINFIRFAYERWVIFLNNRFNRKNLFAISIANTGTDISRHPLIKEADVIHLHWINQGFLSLEDIRKLTELGKPVVWTMHDMWCFTGVCHYAGNCRKYVTQCENCALIKKNITDKTKHLFAKKKSAISACTINFVGCSQWIAKKAKESALLRNAAITAIPNAIDTGFFKPCDKMYVRQKFNLPNDKKLILFAAAKLSDTRKGMTYFVNACEKLVAGGMKELIEIVFLGGEIDVNLLPVTTLNAHVLGYLKTPAEISMIYAACDIFVTSSLEDNLPNTIMEAMACGIPCVGFNIGGIPEMIDHKVNGYVAEYKSSEDLAAGIDWCLNPENRRLLSEQALLKARNCYVENVVARQYVEIYERSRM